MKLAQDKYQNACTTVGLAPNSYILKELKKHILHIRIEKVRAEEWKPLLKCLENDSSIVNVILEYSGNPKTIILAKKNVIKSNFTLSVKNLLFKSLTSCLMCSSSILKLSVINIPMKRSHIETLSKGLTRNQSLECLCLKGSILGHKAFDEIFPVIRKCLNITQLDFTNCKLTEESCSLIGCLLRSQILERHTETWKQSLRYNNPDLNAVPGIRRITLNGNLIGDEGCETICLALQDDYWVRAIDLQQCDVTDEGAKVFLVMLEDNASLCVLDLRLNPQITDQGIITKIHGILERNRNSCSESYENGELLNSRKTPKAKTTIRKSISNLNMRNSLNETKNNYSFRKTSQYENYYSSLLKKSVVKNQESLNDIQLLDDKAKYSPILVHRSSTPSKPRPGSDEIRKKEESQIFVMLDELKRDLQMYKEELYDEKEKTRVLTSKVNELERENILLKHQQLQLDEHANELAPDLLETIETSFSQFHNFLDLLKQAGYGDLCQLINK